jgi:nicotinamide mononucleotide (NMN) deamidase PncC
MDAALQAHIAALHATCFRYVLVLNGGVSAAGHLLAVPGGSRTVLEVHVPYNEEALADFLACRPESFCSAATARAMAARALERARWLAPGANVAGVSCSASLRSAVAKRGEHRFHIAVQTVRGFWTYSVTLLKDARPREGEEEVVATALLNVLAEASGSDLRLPPMLLPGEEVVREAGTGGPLAEFLTGVIPAVCLEPDGRVRPDAPRPTLLLPGSFNPLHHGHTTMAETAAAAAGAAVAFEMTVLNADKPPLADEEVRRRLAQFSWRSPLWLTRQPTFPGKARLFPGASFIVGADTAARVVDPRFYGGDPSRRDSELGDFRSRGCRFLVAGRADPTGRFLGIDDLDIPGAHRDLFGEFPARSFRVDVSSTGLRTTSGN